MFSGRSRVLQTALTAAVVALTGHAVAQTAPSPLTRLPAGPAIAEGPTCGGDPVPCRFDACSPVCVPAPRVKVIIPPPEIIFRHSPCGARPCTPKTESCAPPPPAAPAAAPAATAATAPGMVTITQTRTVPFMTYRWVPVVLPSSSIAGAGFSSGLAGASLDAGLLGQADAGLNFGAGFGGLSMASGIGLGNAPLAGSGFGASAGTSDLGMQLLRAMLARTTTSPLDKAGVTPAAAPQTLPDADRDCETRIKKLNVALLALDAKLNAEITRLRDSTTETDRQLTTRLLGTTDQTDKLRGRVEELHKRLKEIEDNKKIKELLGK